MKTIEELKAEGIARASCEKLGWKVRSLDGQAEVDRLTNLIDEYMHQFAAPTPDGTCIRCGARLGGPIGVWLGLGHGDAFCSFCNYPARIDHNIGNGEVTATCIILQYHPDEVEVTPYGIPQT